MRRIVRLSLGGHTNIPSIVGIHKFLLHISLVDQKLVANSRVSLFPPITTPSHPKHLHHFVAQVVDDLHGDAAR